MASSQILFGKYEVGKLLGCGAFAKVFHARDTRTGHSLAIKIINKTKLLSSNPTITCNIKREIAIMRRLRHPHIVRLHEVLATKTKIFFVMEFVKGGELFAKISKSGKLTEDQSRRYFQQLISAIRYCHSRGVYHRDLKPENLLIDDNGDLKVSDFGLSAFTQQQHGLLHTLCGTPSYVAPDILSKKGYDGAKVDVWTCGVVLFVLNAGYLPFSDSNLMMMYQKICNGEYKCAKWMSTDLKRFLSRLLDTNPATRITIDEILKDPWFKKGLKRVKFSEDMYAEPQHVNLNSTKEELVQVKEKKIDYLNAFDIISFSSGLDLSGMLDESCNPLEDSERLVVEESVETVMERVEEMAKRENMRLKKKKEWGVEIKGQRGKFIISVDIYRVTHGFIVVEVRRRGGDVCVYKEVCKNKLMPMLLVQQQTQNF